ncbi:MAG TPA: protein-L-isoaspartate O-methyltransferase [bacterium]|nr:protein-L-isoaspartate O-methyltransferase [bacterium]
MATAYRNNGALCDAVASRWLYLGILQFDASVVKAMRGIDRGEFAPPGAREVYVDAPIPIGSEQTCSQPSMVAAMATMLELAPGMRVLEVGAGCGYSAAVTASLISPGGSLFAVEFLPELAETARANLAAFSFGADIEVITGDGSAGLAARAPFDRIYFAAGAGFGFDESPLLEQLKPGGVLLYPQSRGDMFRVKKNPDGSLSRGQAGGVVFVELKGKNSGGF